MDPEMALQRQNQEFLKKLEMEKRLNDYVVQSTKLVITLNSGAAIAMLAFSQALLVKSLFSIYETFALSSLSIFLAGACAGALSLIVRGQLELHVLKDTSFKRLWRSAYAYLFGGAFITFIFGSIIAGYGLYATF